MSNIKRQSQFREFDTRLGQPVVGFFCTCKVQPLLWNDFEILVVGGHYSFFKHVSILQQQLGVGGEWVWLVVGASDCVPWEGL